MNLLYWEKQARDKIASYERLMEALELEVEGHPEQAVEMLRDLDNIEEVHYHIGRIRNYSGRYGEAMENFRKVKRHGEILIIQSLKDEALCHRKMGDLPTAKTLMLESLRRAEAINDPLHTGIALDQLALIYRQDSPEDDPELSPEELHENHINLLNYAIDTHELAISILRKTGQKWVLGEAYNHLGGTQLHKANVRTKAEKPADKEYDRAEKAFRRALRALKGDPLATSTIHIQLVRLSIYRSDWKSCKQYLDKANALEAQLNRPEQKANLLTLEAQYLAATDDLEGAKAAATEARDIYMTLQKPAMASKLEQYLHALNMTPSS